MPLIQLKDLTIPQFTSSEITSIDTFPFMPSGLLKKHVGDDPRADNEKHLKDDMQNMQESNRFIEKFSEKQKNSLNWIMAALIGVFGNLAVNLGFSSPVIGTNLLLMTIPLIIVGISIGVYLLYLPKIFITYRFLPKFHQFPKNYEKYILQPCLNSFSNAILTDEYLNTLVDNFAVTVKLAILKDCIKKALSNSTYIKISDITQADSWTPLVRIQISVNGFRPWLNREASKKLGSELSQLNQAFLNAHQICSVRAFELDPEEWKMRGSDFLDSISNWDFKQVQKTLIDIIKS